MAGQVNMPFVACNMSFQACGCEEAFLTSFPIANVFTLARMCGLDVVSQMRVSEEVLSTGVVGAGERAIICMRPNMLC